jgi:hypothetical protein
LTWAQTVRKTLKMPPIANGIAQVAVEWMSDHIQNSQGRGAGGKTVAHLPLKNVTSVFKTTTKPRKGVFSTRYQTVTVDGKTKVRKLYLVQQSGYRNGGHPLRDTGDLFRSLHADGITVGETIRIKMGGNKYGLYQDRGFKTKGPNYIPLTMKGKRGHGTGNNPNKENLSRGKDFMMAWKGVTVPARPFILPTRDDLRTLGVSIYLGLKILLKGK